jgi:hypothetical protein
MAFTQDRWDKVSKFFKEKADERKAAYAAAPEVLALKITYEEPAPDGTFEILFMTRDEVQDYKKQQITGGHWATSRDVIEEVSFAEGVALARRDDCCGGFYALKDARRFQAINPVVQALALDI